MELWPFSLSHTRPNAPAAHWATPLTRYTCHLVVPDSITQPEPTRFPTSILPLALPVALQSPTLLLSWPPQARTPQPATRHPRYYCQRRRSLRGRFPSPYPFSPTHGPRTETITAIPYASTILYHSRFSLTPAAATLHGLVRCCRSLGAAVSALQTTITTTEHELTLLPLNSPITIPALSQVKLKLSGTVGALLESSYLFVAATVLKMGERHVTTSCSANNTMIVKV